MVQREGGDRLQWKGEGRDDRPRGGGVRLLAVKGGGRPPQYWGWGSQPCFCCPVVRGLMA